MEKKITSPTSSLRFKEKEKLARDSGKIKGKKWMGGDLKKKAEGEGEDFGSSRLS